MVDHCNDGSLTPANRKRLLTVCVNVAMLNYGCAQGQVKVVRKVARHWIPSASRSLLRLVVNYVMICLFVPARFGKVCRSRPSGVVCFLPGKDWLRPLDALAH